MKKKGRDVFRKVFLGVLIILVLGVIVFAGTFFVFGNDLLDTVGDGEFFAGSSRSADAGDRGVENVNNLGDDRMVSSGGGGSGGASSSSDDSSEVTCPMQQVQYSLGNFVEKAECLLYGVGGCEKVKVICSAELYNLDRDVGGLFGIQYSLTSGNEVLEVKVVEADVGTRSRVILRTEIVKDGLFDVGKLGCSIDMESVPMKCI